MSEIYIVCVFKPILDYVIVLANKKMTKGFTPFRINSHNLSLSYYLTKKKITKIVFCRQ